MHLKTLLHFLFTLLAVTFSFGLSKPSLYGSMDWKEFCEKNNFTHGKIQYRLKTIHRISGKGTDLKPFYKLRPAVMNLYGLYFNSLQLFSSPKDLNLPYQTLVHGTDAKADSPGMEFKKGWNILGTALEENLRSIPKYSSFLDSLSYDNTEFLFEGPARPDLIQLKAALFSFSVPEFDFPCEWDEPSLFIETDAMSSTISAKSALKLLTDLGPLSLQAELISDLRDKIIIHGLIENDDNWKKILAANRLSWLPKSSVKLIHSDSDGTLPKTRIEQKFLTGKMKFKKLIWEVLRSKSGKTVLKPNPELTNLKLIPDTKGFKIPGDLKIVHAEFLPEGIEGKIKYNQSIPIGRFKLVKEGNSKGILFIRYENESLNSILNIAPSEFSKIEADSILLIIALDKNMESLNLGTPSIEEFVKPVFINSGFTGTFDIPAHGETGIVVKFKSPAKTNFDSLIHADDYFLFKGSITFANQNPNINLTLLNQPKNSLLAKGLFSCTNPSFIYKSGSDKELVYVSTKATSGKLNLSQIPFHFIHKQSPEPMVAFFSESIAKWNNPLGLEKLSILDSSITGSAKTSHTVLAIDGTIKTKSGLDKISFMSSFRPEEPLIKSMSYTIEYNQKPDPTDVLKEQTLFLKLIKPNLQKQLVKWLESHRGILSDYKSNYGLQFDTTSIKIDVKPNQVETPEIQMDLSLGQYPLGEIHLNQYLVYSPAKHLQDCQLSFESDGQTFPSPSFYCNFYSDETIKFESEGGIWQGILKTKNLYFPEILFTTKNPIAGKENLTSDAKPDLEQWNNVLKSLLHLELKKASKKPQKSETSPLISALENQLKELNSDETIHNEKIDSIKKSHQQQTDKMAEISNSETEHQQLIANMSKTWCSRWTIKGCEEKWDQLMSQIKTTTNSKPLDLYLEQLDQLLSDEFSILDQIKKKKAEVISKIKVIQKDQSTPQPKPILIPERTIPDKPIITKVNCKSSAVSMPALSISQCTISVFGHSKSIELNDNKPIFTKKLLEHIFQHLPNSKQKLK
jgi:hypothetical protein